MDFRFLVSDPRGALLAGIICVILGATLFLARLHSPHGLSAKFCKAILLVLISASVVAITVGQKNSWWVPLVAITLTWAWCSNAQASARASAQTRINRLLGQPLFHAMALVAIGIGGICACSNTSLVVADWQGEQDPDSLGSKPRVKKLSEQAVTDAGSSVNLLCPIPEDNSAKSAAREEQSMFQSGLGLRLMRVNGPDPASNCHGWVFADGQFWISEEDVDRILLENGYQQVSSPRKGDVIIYRYVDGHPIHSGVVRVADDDLILIESKWAHLGRFLHTPDDSAYGEGNFTYYRSARKGNTLKGIEAAVKLAKK